MLNQTQPLHNTAGRQRILAALILALLTCALMGCQAHGVLGSNSSGPVPGSVFTAPAQLLAQLDAHGVSATGQTKPGAMYESTLPSNHVAINGAALDFTPAWDPAGSHLFSDLAYAIYLFDGTGLSGASAVTAVWATVPAAANLWVGLADFSNNRWAWFQPGVAAPLAITDLAPYIAPADGRILVAYVLTGTAASTLTSVTLGEAVPELPLPVVPLTPIPMGGTGLAGPVPVDGNPAFAFIEDQGGPMRLIFVRALDSDGTTWGAAVEITASGYCSPGLAIIDGFPAVAYQSSGGLLMYCRAANAQGSSWGTPVEVDGATFGAGSVAELLDVSGRPAIAYLANGSGENDWPALYIRADDATGSAWSATPTVLDPEYITGDQARYMSFAVIDGNPAVAYNWVSSSGAGLRYVRANDATGTTWSTPAGVPGTGYDTANMLRNVDLVDLGGLPGMAYFIEDFGVETNSAVYFTDAQDVAGAAWDPPQVVLQAQVGEDPVNFGSLHVLTRQDGTQRAIVVATRDGTVLNDRADFFVATVPAAGGADFASGTKHMIARFQLTKGSSLLRGTSCYDSVDAIGVMMLIAVVGGDELVQLYAGMQGYDLGTDKMGVSTTHATLPAENF
jgi:hypothetical protein